VKDPALSLVEEAIMALGRGDVAGARSAMAAAAAQERSLGAVADAMAFAAAELEAEGAVSPAAWNALTDACPAELRSVVEAWR
jgi:hypothetical protein